ncbi:DUF2975 domain-containing protein [Frigidibacter sp. ROC022]|uniref:DUF2975 domain-containing protein n=1 Tax=Frigidibacter sp. ROC022 TaxID=2971796 RepID=UPI00215B03DA|nr:DUF2975 domain-containing protein [Frigidibacter sp. ROC022]MCR8724258.1 DUF2975 domain-containing protein [Frigidibacter sp. ROC022]
MEELRHLRRWAAVLRVLTIVAMVILVLALVYGILFAVLPDGLRRAARLVPETSLSGPHRAAVALVGAVPGFAMLYVLGRMADLFGLYAGGEALSPACARNIQRIGVGLLAAVALELVARPAQIALVSLANPPGQRVLSISFEGADLGQILAAGLLITIGWTQREAARIARENEGFV